MDAAKTLREARKRAGLTQAELARLTGTSQGAISAYESGRKDPSVATLSRLLSATGSRLEVRSGPAIVVPSRRQHERVARQLSDVLGLAETIARSRPDPARLSQ
jgi:transcriptional regulator with XRE-family HTH domain